MPFKTISPKTFLKHSQQSPNTSFFQTLEMADLLEKRGFHISYVAYAEADDIKISAIVNSKPMMGGLAMEIYYGPIINDSAYLDTFYREFLSYAKQKGALEVIVKPYQIYQSFDSHGKETSPKQEQLLQQLTSLGFKHDGFGPDLAAWHYEKSLSGLTVETLLNSYNSNSKRNIKKAQQLGITVRAIGYEELPKCKEILDATSARQGFDDKSLDYYQKLYQSFGDQVLFLMAELNPEQVALTKKRELQSLDVSTKKGQQEAARLEKVLAQLETLAQQYGSKTIPLAALVLLLTPNEAYYLAGGYDSAFQKLSAPFLLQYQAMLESLKRGIPSYNFLGIQGIFDGSDGVLRFKQNFNGYITRKMGTFRYYPRPLKYKLIQGLKKLLRRS